MISRAVTLLSLVDKCTVMLSTREFYCTIVPSEEVAVGFLRQHNLLDTANNTVSKLCADTVLYPNKLCHYAINV